jgi:hypothetical protein
MKAARARSLWLGASYLGDIGEDFWIRVRPDGKLTDFSSMLKGPS